jgi:hypothetical protein
MGIPGEPSSPLHCRSDFFIGGLGLSDQKARLHAWRYQRTPGAPGQIAAPLGGLSVGWVRLRAISRGGLGRRLACGKKRRLRRQQPKGKDVKGLSVNN